MPRRVNSSDRSHLIKAYEDGRDYIALANAIGINRRTAYRIISTFKRQHRREALPATRAGRSKILSQEMLDSLIAFVQEKPTETLLEMRGRLLSQFPSLPPNLSLTTISRALDGCLITLKLLRSVPTQWNIAEVKEERAKYVSWFMREGIQRHAIFIDECGFNVWTARTQGRSPQGERAVRIVEGQRGRNLTVCLAVSPTFGLVHFMFVEGGMTKDTFSSFISEVSALLFDESIFLIYDNAPSHRDCPQPLSDDHELQPLPRYSPFLNMTERAISCLKSDAKRRLTDPRIQSIFSDQTAARSAGVTLHRHRMNILRQQIEEAMSSITSFKCHQWHNRSLFYTEKCLNKEDIVD